MIRRDLRSKSISGNWGTTTMSRTLAVVFSTIVAAISMTGAASAGCYNCYTPPPCTTCYQQQYVQPQYRAVDETVMVSPGATVAHRTPAQYRTVMVAPPSVQYERIPPQYATRQSARARQLRVAVVVCVKRQQFCAWK